MTGAAAKLRCLSTADGRYFHYVFAFVAFESFLAPGPTIVPIATARDYFSALLADGIDTKFVEDPDAGHQWLPEAPAEVPAWFMAH
jgi:hypothetical protein